MDDIQEIKNIIYEAIKLAKRYKDLTGKPLGITGEVAEVLVSEILKLKLLEVRTPGYDSIDQKGIKYQIKGRVVKSLRSTKGRTSKIDIEKSWDYLLLGLMNEDYDMLQIIKASRNDVINEITKPGSKSRNQRWTLSIRKVRQIGKIIYP